MTGKIAVLGAGRMGEALLAGLLKAGRDVLVAERRADRADELRHRYGVEVLGNADAVAKADVLLMLVKPQDMGELLDEIAGVVRTDHLVVSLAAGITIAFVESRLPDGVPVARVMYVEPDLYRTPVGT